MAQHMGPSNPAFRGTAMPMRVTQPKIQKHADNVQPVNVQLGAGPSGLANNVENMNPMAMAEKDFGYGPQNVCAQSINSDVFSQFSMPSNNLMVNNMNANINYNNNIGGAFSMTNMSQTGPRIRRPVDGDDLAPPTEIYRREGGAAGAPPPNIPFPRSGMSESQSDFNSGIQSLNARAQTGGTIGAVMINQVGNGVPLSMCQSNYDNDMNAQTSYY